MTDIVERIQSRIHDAPLPTEYLLDEAADEIEWLKNLLVQIRHVCRDNEPESCNHRMALAFVRQLADAPFSPADRTDVENTGNGQP